MAKGVERVGDTGLKLALDFPDTEMREDFEIAFRGWLKQYQQAAGTQRLVGALAARTSEEGDDTGGYLFYLKSAKQTIYLDFIGDW